MVEKVYQIGSAICVLLGLIYAVVGIFEKDCPFIGRGRYTDSVISRFFVGAAIGSIWPVFIPFAIWFSARPSTRKSNVQR